MGASLLGSSHLSPADETKAYDRETARTIRQNILSRFSLVKAYPGLNLMLPRSKEKQTQFEEFEKQFISQSHSVSTVVGLSNDWKK